MSIPDRNSRSDLRSLISSGSGGATASRDLRKLIRATTSKTRGGGGGGGGKAIAAAAAAAAAAASASASKSKRIITSSKKSSSSSNGARIDLRKVLKKSSGAGVIKKSSKVGNPAIY